MKRPWFIPITLVLILIGGIALLLAQLFLPGPPIRVSPQTTYLTTPLAPDGLPDYAGYLLDQGGQGVTPQNNGAIPYLQAMWPAGLEPEDQGPLCQHLGMVVPTEDGMDEPSSDKTLEEAILMWLESLYGVEKAENEGVEADDLFSGSGGEKTLEEWLWDVWGHVQSNPWKRSELPLLAEWIDDHTRHYDLLHEAVSRPKLYLPPAELLINPQANLRSTRLSTIQTQRAAARCLMIRAQLHLGEGDVVAAWKDCAAMYQLSGWNSHEGLVNDLIGIAISSMADVAVLGILDSQQLTPEVARQIHAFQQSRTPRTSMIDAIDGGERLTFVTTIFDLAGQRGEGAASASSLLTDFNPSQDGGIAALAYMSVNWNIVLERGNAWYDRVAAAGRISNWGQRHQALTQLQNELSTKYDEVASTLPTAIFSRTTRSELMATRMLYLFLPSLQAATSAEDRSNAKLQLGQVAAALEVHRLEHKSYPAQLDELVPGLLATLPVDPYGRPLVYRQTDRGYLLYSLGENGKDDSGSNRLIEVYQGYEVYQEQEAAVRELLGFPSLKSDEDQPMGGLSSEELTDPTTSPLSDRIAEDADDWAIRLPLPRLKLPLPTPQTPQE